MATLETTKRRGRPATQRKWVTFVQIRWLDFVKAKRDSKNSYYTRDPSLELPSMASLKMNRVLVREAVHTRDTVIPADPKIPTTSKYPDVS